MFIQVQLSSRNGGVDPSKVTFSLINTCNIQSVVELYDGNAYFNMQGGDSIYSQMKYNDFIEHIKAYSSYRNCV